MQTIYLDISNKGVIPCIMAKQSEVGRKFLAVITDNGVPYNIAHDSLLSVWYEGNTDAGNYSSIEEKSAFSIDGNKVTVELVAQMLLKPGKGELCLSITHGDGGETNTWNIPYEVEYKPGAGSAVPTEYYTALTDAAARAAEQVALAKEQASEAERQALLAKQGAEEAINKLPLEGGTMAGQINMDGYSIFGLSSPTMDDEVATKSYVDNSKKVIRVTTVGTNLDDYKEDGIYYFDSSVTPDGIPIGVNGWLVVMGAGGLQNYKQIWLRMGTPNNNDHQVFIRTWGNIEGVPSWGNWTNPFSKLTENADYGASLPASGVKGQLFYLYKNGAYTIQIHDGSSWKPGV